MSRTSVENKLALSRNLYTQLEPLIFPLNVYSLTAYLAALS